MLNQKVQDFLRSLSEEERQNFQLFLPKLKAIDIYGSLAPDKNSVRPSASESIEQTVGRQARFQRIERLGAPLKVTQAEWWAYGRGEALPEAIEIEIEVRLLILANELNVDIFAMDKNWRDVTARRVVVRLLTGHGTDRRRFPVWLLGDEKSGPFRVVRPSRKHRKVTDAELDKLEAVLAKKRVRGAPQRRDALIAEGFARTRIKSLLGALKRRREKRRRETRAGLSDRK